LHSPSPAWRVRAERDAFAGQQCVESPCQALGYEHNGTNDGPRPSGQALMLRFLSSRERWEATTRDDIVVEVSAMVTMLGSKTCRDARVTVASPRPPSPRGKRRRTRGSLLRFPPSTVFVTVSASAAWQGGWGSARRATADVSPKKLTSRGGDRMAGQAAAHRPQAEGGGAGILGDR